jgi:hypothetical protein
MWQRYLRRLGWLDVFTAFLVAAGIILAVAKDYLEGGVLIAVVLVATQLLPRAIEWYKGQREQDHEEASLLRIRRPISEIDPFEEGLVFRSALAERDYPDREPAYNHRGDRGDIDAKLDEALQSEQFVLVTGTSKSGKTRTAFEAVRRMQPEPILLVPATSRALPELLNRGLPMHDSRPSVLWLDELDRYLQDPGLSRALFDDLRKYKSHVVILATVTLTAYNRLHRGRSTREILSLFETEMNLSSELSPSEHEEAQRLYPSQRFTAGIGEYFAAARELIDRFKAAIEDNRHGFAVVVAALD